MPNPGEYNFYGNNEERVEVVPNEVTNESDETDKESNHESNGSNEKSEVLTNLTRNTVEEHEENNETSIRYSLRSRSTVPELPNVMQIPIKYARRKKE